MCPFFSCELVFWFQLYCTLNMHFVSSRRVVLREYIARSLVEQAEGS